MTEQSKIKPSFEEWLYWTQVIVDRLTTVVHVYSKPPFPDVFMAEDEKQFKIRQTVETLRHLHTLTDEADMANPRMNTESLTARDEDIVAALEPHFQSVLSRLPTWSEDMQLLLKSPWFENCTGRLATELFKGPQGREAEGIGSGQAVHGRLPAVIDLLLEREAMGDIRAPREEQPPKSTPKLQREELARRWGRRNSSFLRTAGRVD